MNGDKTLANIAYANRGEQEERFARLELEKQELEAKYKDLQEEKRLVGEECERYKKMFSEERGKNIELEEEKRLVEEECEQYKEMFSDALNGMDKNE